MAHENKYVHLFREPAPGPMPAADDSKPKPLQEQLADDAKERQEKMKEYFPEKETTASRTERQSSEPQEKTRGSLSGGREIVPKDARGSRTEKPPVPFQSKSGERTPAAVETGPLADSKSKMDELAELYAKYSGEAYASQGFIKRLVGVHKENDPMIFQFRERWAQAKDAYEKALNDDLRKKFEEGKISEKDYKTQGIELIHQSLLRKLEIDEKKIFYQNKKGEEREWLSKKVEASMGKFVDKWRKLPFRYKFTAAIALGLIGGPASIVGLGALRIVGAIAGGKAAQEKLQALAIEKRKKDIEKDVRKFEMSAHLLGAQELHGLANDKLDSYNKLVSDKIVSEANWDAGRKITGILTGVAIEELGRLGVGKIILNKLLSYMGLDILSTQVVGGGKGAIAPEGGGGKGAIVPEKIGEGKIPGFSYRIEEGSNVWATTRQMYMDHPSTYGYNPADHGTQVKLHKLFTSFQQQGILEKMGIDAENYRDLSEMDKLKIWSENQTANSIKQFKILHHGQSIPDIVKPHSTVTLNGNHVLEFAPDSGIKAGQLAPEATPGAGRAATAATEGHYQRPTLVDQKWQAALDQKDATGRALEAARADLATASAAEQAAIDNTGIHQLMDSVQEKIYGQGTTIDWEQSAQAFKNKMLGSFIASDQQMAPGPNFDDQREFWKIAQGINAKLGPVQGNETVEQWVQRALAAGRVSPDEIAQAFPKVANG